MSVDIKTVVIPVSSIIRSSADRVALLIFMAIWVLGAVLLPCGIEVALSLGELVVCFALRDADSVAICVLVASRVVDAMLLALLVDVALTLVERFFPLLHSADRVALVVIVTSGSFATDLLALLGDVALSLLQASVPLLEYTDCVALIIFMADWRLVAELFSFFVDPALSLLELWLRLTFGYADIYSVFVLVAVRGLVTCLDTLGIEVALSSIDWCCEGRRCQSR